GHGRGEEEEDNRLIRTRLTPRARVTAAGMGVLEELVDGPLVVGVLSVFDRSDSPVGSDQEICRQPEATAGGFDRSEDAARRTALLIAAASPAIAARRAPPLSSELGPRSTPSCRYS